MHVHVGSFHPVQALIYFARGTDLLVRFSVSEAASMIGTDVPCHGEKEEEHCDGRRSTRGPAN